MTLLYGLLFFLAVASALLMVFSRHAVHSALFLIVTMAAIAANFVLIDAQLAAVLQILVYAGAIMVVFLFVIMLLDLKHAPEPPESAKGVRRAAALLGGALMLQTLALAVKAGSGSAIAAGAERHATAGLREVAIYIFTRYFYAFEMTAALLLIATIGAMTLGRRSLARRPEGGEPV